MRHTAKKLEISDDIRYTTYLGTHKDLFMKNGQQTTKVIFKVK